MRSLQRTRYNAQTLEVKYKGKTIADVLEMRVDEADEFFANIPRMHNKLRTICDVGLATSRWANRRRHSPGGEAQRVKLATELSRRSTGRTFYVLDEPTTGLHFADIHKLLEVLNRLVELGNTVLVIEHNLDVIKTADYSSISGPKEAIAEGPSSRPVRPKKLRRTKRSYTGAYLVPVLRDQRAVGHHRPDAGASSTASNKRICWFSTTWRRLAESPSRRDNHARIVDPERSRRTTTRLRRAVSR